MACFTDIFSNIVTRIYTWKNSSRHCNYFLTMKRNGVRVP
uniref:Uncharacterized protein n=1 Tax=Anguilla anguilla TaxID=7936 RepID=A0A0E9PWX6_ANGAN